MSRSTSALASVRSGTGSAIDSSEASETSDAVGYLNQTWSKSIAGAVWLAGSGTAPGASSMSGFRSSTSKTRSKLTSAVITSTWTLDSDVDDKREVAERLRAVADMAVIPRFVLLAQQPDVAAQREQTV